MKKCMYFVAILLLVVFPLNVFAEVETMGIVDACSAEGIEVDATDYVESTNKINIYLFRRDGCSHCQDFLTFLSSILPTYGKYFNLVSYEVYGNSDNASLMDKVASSFGTEADGVPYIIIGDKDFVGYASDYDDQIKAAILEQFNSNDRYDVMEELSNPSGVSSKELSSFYNNIVSWMIVLTVLNITFVFIKSNKDKKEMLSLLSK